MKNLLILTIIFSFFASAQTGKINYSVKNIGEKKPGFKTLMDEELSLITFELVYDEENSFFTKLKHIPNNDLHSKAALSVIGSRENHFQYLKTKEDLKNVTLKNITYRVDDSRKMNNWKLTNESTIINGYTCFKATQQDYNKRSEKYFTNIAWYTPQIPASYGPAGYGGLPGLILQLNYKSNVYNATEITLNPAEIKIPTIKDGEKITVDRYVELMRAARKVTED